MSYTPYPTNPVALDAQGHIDTDLSCLRCGYNLRGLNPDGVCPECGTAIGRSQYGNLLRYCDPDWVEQLASGMNWMVASIVLGLVLGIIAGGIAGATKGASASSLVMDIVQVFVAIISLIAYWKVTQPDPSQNEEGTTVRKVARFAAVASFVIGFMSHGAQHLDRRLAIAISSVAGVVGLVQFIVVFVYARQLALRIPEQQLADRTRLVMWGLIISQGLILAGGTMAYLTFKSAGRGAAPAWVGVGVVSCGAGLGMIIFGIWSLLLILRYRRALSDAAQRARATWVRDIPVAASAQ